MLHRRCHGADALDEIWTCMAARETRAKRSLAKRCVRGFAVAAVAAIAAAAVAALAAVGAVAVVAFRLRV